MPYKDNKSLPDNLNVLPNSAKTIWRNAYNSSYYSDKDEEKAIKIAWTAVKNAYKQDGDKWVKKFTADCEVMKADDSLGVVFGWGMITDIDGEPYRDTDKLRIDSGLMVKATTEFMENSRVNNDNHTANDIGVVIHSFPLSKEIADSMGIQSRVNGWMVGVKPSPEIFQKYKSGEYTGFSIEGTGELVDEE